MWVPFANAKATHIFSAKVLAYMPYLINDQGFNDLLTNDIISFEQLGPELLKKKNTLWTSAWSSSWKKIKDLSYMHLQHFLT